MLPRALRLRDSRSFQAVYRRGRSWTNRFLALHVLARPEPERRFGFVVGKKLGGAVQRNQVRRRLREACRSLISHIPPGFDVIVAGRPAAAEASLAELRAALQMLLERAGLWIDLPAGDRIRPAGGENTPGPASEGKSTE